MQQVETPPISAEDGARRRRRLARIAGALYLGLVACSGFAELYVRARVVQDGDAATVANLVADDTLFRIGFLSDLVGITCFLLLAMALHRLLQHVHRDVANAMVVFVAVAVAIMCANLLNHLAALAIATDAPIAAGFEGDGSDTLVLMFLELHESGYRIAQVFFGLWLLPLGYLVRRSGYFPRLIGTLLMVGGFGYLADVFVTFAVPSFGPDLTAVLTTPADIGELALMGWLLVRGVRTRRDGSDPGDRQAMLESRL